MKKAREKKKKELRLIARYDSARVGWARHLIVDNHHKRGQWPALL